MKELSIEEKAERYDEALEKAKIWQEHLNESGDNDYAKELSYIFPELKESDDERIRKKLISFVKNWNKDGIFSKYTSNTNDIKRILAWLEKQGEQKPKEVTLTYEVETGDGNIKALVTDKVQLPKFKVGDWIVSNHKKDVFLIKGMNCGYFIFEDINGNIYPRCLPPTENDYHLWTIQDAKDGDVLVHDGCTFIFMGVKNGVVLALEEDLLEGANPVCFGSKNEDYCPATKEQRDLLFAKMKEAGYEWDLEKKELKKIIEEVNGEDYGIDGLWHAQRILEKTLGKVDGYQSDDGILEHKAAITAVKKLYEQNPAWSEEDEWKFADILALLSGGENCHYNTPDLVTWLKSLKQRIGE